MANEYAAVGSHLYPIKKRSYGVYSDTLFQYDREGFKRIYPTDRKVYSASGRRVLSGIRVYSASTNKILLKRKELDIYSSQNPYVYKHREYYNYDPGRSSANDLNPLKYLKENGVYYQRMNLDQNRLTPQKSQDTKKTSPQNSKKENITAKKENAKELKVEKIEPALSQPIIIKQTYAEQSPPIVQPAIQSAHYIQQDKQVQMQRPKVQIIPPDQMLPKGMIYSIDRKNAQRRQKGNKYEIMDRKNQQYRQWMQNFAVSQQPVITEYIASSQNPNEKVIVIQQPAPQIIQQMIPNYVEELEDPSIEDETRKKVKKIKTKSKSINTTQSFIKSKSDGVRYFKDGTYFTHSTKPFLIISNDASDFYPIIMSNNKLQPYRTRKITDLNVKTPDDLKTKYLIDKPAKKKRDMYKQKNEIINTIGQSNKIKVKRVPQPLIQVTDKAEEPQQQKSSQQVSQQLQASDKKPQMKKKATELDTFIQELSKSYIQKMPAPAVDATSKQTYVVKQHHVEDNTKQSVKQLDQAYEEIDPKKQTIKLKQHTQTDVNSSGYPQSPVWSRIWPDAKPSTPLSRQYAGQNHPK